MSSVPAVTAYFALVKAAAGTIPVQNGLRKLTDAQAKEPPRPYIRVSMVKEHQPTGIPGRWRALGLIEIFGEDPAQAWAKGSELLTTLGTGGAVCAPPRPNPIDTYWQVGALEEGEDPGGGALVYATIGFHYY